MLIFIRVVEKFHSSINKIALIDRFHEIETDGELIFQLFYYIIEKPILELLHITSDTSLDIVLMVKI